MLLGTKINECYQRLRIMNATGYLEWWMLSGTKNNDCFQRLKIMNAIKD